MVLWKSLVSQFSDQSYVPVIVIGFITFYQNIIVITRYSIHVVSQSASTEISLFLSTSCVHHRSEVGWIPKPKSNPEKCAWQIVHSSNRVKELTVCCHFNNSRKSQTLDLCRPFNSIDVTHWRLYTSLEYN